MSSLGLYLLLAIFISLPARGSDLTNVLTREEAKGLAALIQLPGLDKFISDQAKAALVEKIGNKVVEWMGEGIRQTMDHGLWTMDQQQRKIDLREIFKNDPEISKKLKEEIERRLEAWLPGELQNILPGDLFQGDIQKEILADLKKTLNEQADRWIGGWYDQAMSNLKQKIENVREKIPLENLSYFLQGTLPPGFGILLSDQVGDAMGQSSVRGLQNNILKGLHGELPDEALKYLQMGPDKFAEYVEKGRTYLPAAQFAKLKNQWMGLHIVDLPNQAYGGILAASAAMHLAKFASSCSGFFATCDWNELKRAKEVTETLIWQLRNKKYVSLSLGDFTEMIKRLGDQLGSFHWKAFQEMAKWNPAAIFLKRLDEIEARLKELDKIYDKTTGKILDDFKKSVSDLEAKLKEISEEMLGPMKPSLVLCNGLLEKDCPHIMPKMPEIPDITTWEGLKKALGKEDGIFGKMGERSPLQEISKGLATAAVKVTDALHITGPLAEILDIEKIPPKNASQNSDFEPVFLHNGEFYYTATDVTLPGQKGQGIELPFRRIYRSRSHFLGVLGWNWTHNLAQRLLAWESPQGVGFTYINEEGKKYFFKEVSAGIYQPPKDLDLQLEKTQEGFRLIFPDGRANLFDPKGVLKTIQNPDGDSIELSYNAKEELSEAYSSQGRRLRFQYLPNGLLERMEDATGRVWKYEYNEEGELIAATSPGTPDFPKGKTTRYRYQEGKLTMVMDPKGQIYLQNYYGEFGESKNKIVAQVYGKGEWMAEARYEGLNTWVKDRRGVIHLYGHNEEGEQVRHLIFKNNGAIVEGAVESPPLEKAASREEVLPEDSIYEYDSWGNIVAVRNEKGNERRFEVDATNLITKETVNGEERYYQYDANDNVIRIEVPARNLRLELEYDVLDHRITKKEILNGSHSITTRYEYDPQGRLTRLVYPLGNDVRYIYDEEGKLVQRIRGEGTLERSVETLSVSLRGTLSEVEGRRSNLMESTGSLARARDDISDTAYDSIGRPTRINNIHLEWDDNSRLASLTDDKGQTTQYLYDSLNRLVLEKFPDGWEKSYAYDTADRLTGTIDRDGTPHILKYDDQDRLISRESKNLRQEFYYDEQGRLAKAVDFNNLADPSDDIQVAFAYDDKGRLAGEKIHGRWVYKSFDRLNQKVGITYPNGLEIVRQYEEERLTGLFAGNRPLLPPENFKEEGPMKMEAAPPQNIRRDVNGNGIEDDHFLYGYDALNRLISVQDKKSGEQIYFKYDPFGRLARKENPATKKRLDYFHDEFNLIAAYSSEGTRHLYIYATDLDRPAAFFKDNSPYFYRLDRFGSVKSITDANGRSLEQYDYLPFGEMTIHDGEGNTIASSQFGNELGFLGRPFDFQGRLVNLRFRFYSPGLHEFLTADPLGYKNDFYTYSNVWTPRNVSYHQGQGGASRTTFPNFAEADGKISLLDIDLFAARKEFPYSTPETNLYAYAGGDPIRYFDPLGLYKIDVLLPPWGPTKETNFRDHPGTLNLKREDGSLVIGPFEVLGRSVGDGKNEDRDPRYLSGDTPTGRYRVLYPIESRKNFEKYGPFAIRMDATEGEALLAYQNRKGLLIHGGRDHGQKDLVPTLGCLRLHNSDLFHLVQSIHVLRREGDEKGTIEVKESPFLDLTKM